MIKVCHGNVVGIRKCTASILTGMESKKLLKGVDLAEGTCTKVKYLTLLSIT